MPYQMKYWLRVKLINLQAKWNVAKRFQIKKCDISNSFDITVSFQLDNWTEKEI